jgi:predicted DNA-binding transcriptional regulator AlpA
MTGQQLIWCAPFFAKWTKSDSRKARAMPLASHLGKGISMSADIPLDTPQKMPIQVQPLLGPDTAAATLLGISRAHLHRLRTSGNFGPQAIHLGRKLLFDLEECVAWAKAKCPDARTWAAMQAAESRRLKVS